MEPASPLTEELLALARRALTCAGAADGLIPWLNEEILETHGDF